MTEKLGIQQPCSQEAQANVVRDRGSMRQPISYPPAPDTRCEKGHIAVQQLNGVVAALRHPPNEGLSLPPHFHEEYQVILSEQQLITFHHQGRVLRNPPGTISVIPPGEVHSADWVGSNALRGPMRAFLIPAPLLAQLATEMGGSSHLPYFSSNVLEDHPLFLRMQALHRLMIMPADLLARESMLIESLSQFVSKGKIRQAYPGVSVPERLGRVRDYLAVHSAEQVSLSRLSQIAGLSPFHLLRLFRRQFGLPPHAYQTQIRVNRSKSLLASGQSPIEVAFATGFADQAHFTRVFRKIAGVPPSRYGPHLARSFKTVSHDSL